MKNKKITIRIGEAIREGKYLDIFYKNKQGEVKIFLDFFCPFLK
jgi:hypothetical protein